MSHRPLDDLERFEVLQAMFPDELDDSDDAFDSTEEFIDEKFDVPAEAFDEIVGRVALLAPVLRSPITETAYHVLGTQDGNHFTAAVKREAK